ncbi:MAG: hypothetical protein SFU98_08085 [Leptospiraceae bacterium]|nr:hypothetical protein [Leptospiraceae bacterium]
MDKIEKILGNLDNSFTELKAKEFSASTSFPKGYSKEEYIESKKEAREELREFLKFDCCEKTIFATGHQPELFHPGLLYKDFLISKFAKNDNSIALHVTVDTDVFEYSYLYPIAKNSFAELREFHLPNPDQKIFRDFVLDKTRLEELLKVLESWEENSSRFISKSNLDEFKLWHSRYIELIKTNSIIEANETLRKEFLIHNHRNLLTLKVSELIQFKTYANFVEKIRSNLASYREYYNLALREYREEHKIKNHAQPLPDLAEDEMPFWILENGKRAPMKKDTISDVIIPRAVTLTTFLRLFLCDFFVHGIGGARYEDVSDRILAKLYEFHAAPFEVGTATIYLSNSESFELEGLNEKEIESSLRDINYSPEKFLSPENELAIQKKSLQEKFKDPSSDKKSLHKEIESLNSKMKNLLDEKQLELENAKVKAPLLAKTKEVFSTRTFPFYFYDLKELISTTED